MGLAYVVGTFDTKGDELRYAADLIRAAGTGVVTVDVSTRRDGSRVLGNAAHAMAGMLTWGVPATEDRPAVALTMFAVTTPCVTAVTGLIGETVDPLVFHTTGTGGRVMEKLVDDGLVGSVLDITTTEVCDLVAGDVFAAGEDRLDAIARAGVPYVGSCGAPDAPGQAFWDPDADETRFSTLESEIEQTADRRVARHINDPGFAHASVSAWQEVRA